MALAKHFLYKRLARFHALNPHEKTDIEATIPTPSTYCVQQGPSPAIVDALRRDLSQRTTQRPIRFIFVGRLDVQTKGLDILLHGFALAVRERAGVPPITLSLIGPDWNEGRTHLVSLARNLGVEDQVGFHDSVAAGDVPALFRECDIYVQLSRNEGTPLSINDALVLGKPAILSDRVGTTSFEQISRLRHVQVIEPTHQKTAAAIRYAIDHLDELRSAGQAALADVQAFLSWSRAAELHLQVYESLCEDSGSVLSTGAVAS